MKKSKFLLISAICLMVSTLFLACGPAEDPDVDDGPVGTNWAEVDKPVSTPKPQVTHEVLSEDTFVTIGELENEISQTIPVLAIQTKVNATDSLNFITEPVSSMISEMAASWDSEYVMPPAPYYEDCRISVIDKGEVLLDNSDVKVKVRGNWTSNYDKKPLRLKFKEKTSLLGMNDGGEYKNWVLLAELKDNSLMRDRAAYRLSKAFLEEDGLYTSDSRIVAVVVNGEYQGAYLLAERQEVNEGRVDITEPEKGYEGTDIGYLLEFDGYWYAEDDLNKFHIDYYDNVPLIPYDGNGGSNKTMSPLPNGVNDPKKDIGFTIKSDIYAEAQRDFVAGYVEKVYEIMYEAAYNKKAFVFTDDYSEIKEVSNITPREAVEKVVNLQSLVDMYIVSELTCDADLYYTSFYMSVDFGPEGDKRLTFQAPWDFDSGLGNKVRCGDGNGYYAANIMPDANGDTDWGGTYNAINPWLAVYAYGDGFMDMVKEKWRKVEKTGILEDIQDMVISETELYSTELERNFTKWRYCDSMEEIKHEVCSIERNVKSQAESAEFVARWIMGRVHFLNQEWGAQHQY